MALAGRGKGSPGIVAGLSLCFHGQADQVGDRPNRLRGGEVANAAVQVQPELPGEHFVGGAEAVALAALLEQGQVQFLAIAAEDRPVHLDVAVRGHLDRGPPIRLGSSGSSKTG